MQDKKYRDFQIKLIPDVKPETIIGVRTPDMRKLARELIKLPEARQFFKELPHQYFEENNLHGFMIENLKDYDDCLNELEIFLPYVDNWATCDLMTPKVFKKNLDKLYLKIKGWLKSTKTYTVRFAIEMSMSFYLDGNFKPEMLEEVAAVHSNEYYINMMIAWYFATALAKQPEATLPYIKEKRLDKWVHNKTIQKAIESYRIDNKTKEYLKSLKIK